MPSLLCASILLFAASCSDGLALPGGSADLAGPRCADQKDRASCTALHGCSAPACPACENQLPDFRGCYNQGEEPPIACPAIACAPPCSAHQTEASCDADPLCHGVYADPGTCACAALGCCMMFSGCAEGAPRCQPGVVLCDATPPACGGQYTVGYTESCFEGCVKLSACPPF